MSSSPITYCAIRKGQFNVNGLSHYTGKSDDFQEFAKGLYVHFGIKYPKFHKMDQLCKLGFLGSEYLLNQLSKDQKAQTGLLMLNSASSLDTDIKHYNAYQKSKASPAIFVYTLPNIVIGEVSIRHKIHGESNFLVAPQFDAPLIMAQVDIMFKETDLNYALVAWVDLIKASYEGMFFLLSKKEFKSLSAEDIESIYAKP